MGYVKPGYVKPGYVKGDVPGVIPPMIPTVSLTGGRIGATIMGAAGAFDIPYLRMAALVLMGAMIRLFAWVRSSWGVARRPMDTLTMTKGGAGAG